MNRCHHTGRAITIGLAFMVFSMLLTGCPPRKPTPIAADEKGAHEKLTRNVASPPSHP